MRYYGGVNLMLGRCECPCLQRREGRVPIREPLACGRNLKPNTAARHKTARLNAAGVPREPNAATRLDTAGVNTAGVPRLDTTGVPREPSGGGGKGRARRVEPRAVRRRLRIGCAPISSCATDEF